MTTTDAPWINRITGYGTEAPDQLAANPKNWRVHPKHQQAALKGALDSLGWIQNVIVNQRTGFVVDGHARIALALRHNQAEVPVTYVDLSEAEEALALATLDPISAMAGADKDQLEALLAEINTQDEALLDMLSGLRTDAGLIPSDLEFKEFDESAADDVKYVDCPECGHRFPA